MQLTRFERLSIKQHPELSETWVQDQIAADPKILGLGDLVLWIKSGGSRAQGDSTCCCKTLKRIAEEIRRYEVEIHLVYGATYRQYAASRVPNKAAGLEPWVIVSTGITTQKVANPLALFPAARMFE